MDEDIKIKLHALLQEDQTKVAAVNQAVDLQKQREAEFVSEFIRVRDAIIKPAMQEIADFVANNGWRCEIISTEDRPSAGRESGKSAGIRLMFYRQGEQHRQGHHMNAYPHFGMYCDKRHLKVQLHESTTGPGHGGSSGGSGTVTLDTVTTDYVQHQISEYLPKLLRDARPYPALS